MRGAVKLTGIAVVLLASVAQGQERYGPADLRWAIDIVRAQHTSTYPRAVRVLRAFARDPGRVGHDAREQLDWVESDMKVRLANVARLAGDPVAAIDLLRSAYAHRVLSPEVRALIASRIERLEDDLRARGRRATPPPHGLETSVRATSSRIVPRAHTFGVRDAYDQPHYIHYGDPIALRRSKTFPEDRHPGGRTLLDLLSDLGAPRAVPAARPASSASASTTTAARPRVTTPAPARRDPMRGYAEAIDRAFRRQ